MNPVFPVIELFDRWAIARVKFQKTNGANADELEFYNRQVQAFDISHVESLVQDLEQIHQDIWQLEKELKSGTEHLLPLEEIGRRALAIRDHNNRRIKIKNTIAEQLSCSVREIKQDHLSQRPQHD